MNIYNMNIYKKNVQQYKSYIQFFRCKINYYQYYQYYQHLI